MDGYDEEKRLLSWSSLSARTHSAEEFLDLLRAHAGTLLRLLVE